jgi:hypothetical protein
VSKRLVELAAVRSEDVEIAGESVTVREPSALQMIEHRRLRNGDTEQKVDGDPGRALAYLIHVCCVDQTGAPLWTEDEALTLANGRQEVALPLINAITGWLGREKKVSPTTSDSGTA